MTTHIRCEQCNMKTDTFYEDIYDQKLCAKCYGPSGYGLHEEMPAMSRWMVLQPNVWYNRYYVF